MAGWTHSLGLLQEELIQRRDEGCIIPDDLIAAINALDPQADQWDDEKIDPLYDRLMALPADPDLAAREPSDLESIRALRPDGPRNLDWHPSEALLLDRLHGAWLGRTSGCALGKPVEGIGMKRENGINIGRQRIRTYLENRNDYPLRDYFSGDPTPDGVQLGCDCSHRENIAFMESDDDIHYSLTGLGVLETYGPDFDWHNVVRYWLSHIPILYICTAEIQAVINHCSREPLRGNQRGPTTPEWTATHRNPYREWIGAQIRADGWAWACAGNPELAAEYAWRDACWTHRRNGIYGEMFVAAMIATAFVESDPKKLIAIGLSEIPRDCRLAYWIHRTLEWAENSPDFESCMEKLEAELGTMDPVHTINNACIVAIALLYGEMDETLGPCTAVMCALDTDCNGATVGSIIGAHLGRSGMRGDLCDRLNDTIKPAMLGFQEIKMTTLAQRSAKVWHQVRDYSQSARP